MKIKKKNMKICIQKTINNIYNSKPWPIEIFVRLFITNTLFVFAFYFLRLLHVAIRHYYKIY